jgi:hypothetical protein
VTQQTQNPFAYTPPTAPVPAPAPAPTPAPVAFQAPAPAAAGPAAAPAQPAYVPGGEDPFSGPAPQQARGPRVQDLYGRLLLLVPHKLEEGIPNRLQPGTTQDRMTADVIVLDGGTIHYGGAPEKVPPVPHTKSAEPPLRTPRQFISNSGLISQCRKALVRRQQGQIDMVLGRLTRSTEGNKPYLLTPPTEADKAVARAYLSAVDPFA